MGKKKKKNSRIVFFFDLEKKSKKLSKKDLEKIFKKKDLEKISKKKDLEKNQKKKKMKWNQWINSNFLREISIFAKFQVNLSGKKSWEKIARMSKKMTRVG